MVVARMALERIGLNEIHEGIYSIDGFPMKGRGNLVLAVHPFYGTPPKSYAKNVDKFFRERRGPIVAMEEKPNFERTSSFLCDAAKKNNRFIIRTAIGDPEPIDISWDDIAKFLNNYRGTQPVIAIGGYYKLWGNTELDGCLGWTIHQMRERGVPIKVRGDLVF